MPRRAAQRDENEPEIVAALREVGAEVWLFDDIDLLVAFRGRWQPMEVKMSAKEYRTPRKTRERQEGYRARAHAVGCTIPIVTTVAEALEAIGLEGEGL